MSDIKVTVIVEVSEATFSSLQPGSIIQVDRTLNSGNPRFHASRAEEALLSCVTDARKQVVALFGDKPTEEERTGAPAPVIDREELARP